MFYWILLGKCSIGKMIHWENIPLGKCSIGKIPILGHFHRLHHMAQNAKVRHIGLEGLEAHLGHRHEGPGIRFLKGHTLDIGLHMPRNHILSVQGRILQGKNPQPMEWTWVNRKVYIFFRRYKQIYRYIDGCLSTIIYIHIHIYKYMYIHISTICVHVPYMYWCDLMCRPLTWFDFFLLTGSQEDTCVEYLVHFFLFIRAVKVWLDKDRIRIRIRLDRHAWSLNFTNVEPQKLAWW